MSFTDSTPFLVARVDDTRWQLFEPLSYQGERDRFIIPEGYVTDFASVPRFLQWLAPSTGKYTLASVLHDYLCDSLDGTGVAVFPPGARWMHRDHFRDVAVVTSSEVDGLFRRVMREQGVPVAQRWLMWCGVRWGAMFNPRRRPGILRDAPLMLVLSVLALPLVLPASVCIGVAFVVQYLYDLVAELVTCIRRWVA